LDLDRFVEWLATQEVPESFHALYRQGASKIIDCTSGGPVQPKHVDQAIKREEAIGAPVRALANLQRIGDAMVRYQKEAQRAAAPADSRGQLQVDCARCGKRQPVSRSGSCLFCGASLPEAASPPSMARGQDGERRCRACGGRVVFYDGRQAGGATGGIGGVLAVATGWTVGVLPALMVLFTIGSLGSLAAALSMRFRCDSCWKGLPASTLEPEERRAMLKVRAIVIAAAVGLGVLAVAVAAAWGIMATSRGHAAPALRGR